MIELNPFLPTQPMLFLSKLKLSPGSVISIHSPGFIYSTFVSFEAIVVIFLLLTLWLFF